MYTLGIPKRDYRRATQVLDYESQPSIPYEAELKDDGFYMFEFPGADADTFKKISVKLKGEGIRIVGADEALTEKQIFGEIAKTSKTIQVSLAANPLAIGKAIIAAKQFGAELADIDTIAGSLLNFEQSISSELEAELLTGKQLNLERARLLALNNEF